MSKGKAWGGRFEGTTDAAVERFTESITIDHRLWEQDLAQSLAHAKMLGKVGILTAAEVDAVKGGLERIRVRFEDGSFPFRMELEDVHMHVESALIEDLGDTGRKLHTARSRNDQVATGFRLWVRGAVDRVSARVVAVQKALIDAAKRHQDLVMPAYTHWQRAQPVLASHYLLAYAERLERDLERLADCRRRVNRLPLGTAALAGTSLPIDRDFVAKELGFEAVIPNSLDSSGDRDFAVEATFVLGVLASHLAGWADEWIVMNTTEFGFLKLPDALCTGSSIMPQKKNPDVLELIRGKSAAVMARGQELQLLTYKLPLAYSRDLQEDKKPVFEAFDGTEALLEMMELMVKGMRLDAETIGARIESGYMDATALMELLIKHGVPMRQAHEIVGKAVGIGEKRRAKLAELSLDEWRTAGVPAGIDVASVLGVKNAVAALRSYGSSGPEAVRAQLATWEKRLSGR